MNMTPAHVNLSVYRGDSYSWQFRLWEDTERTVPVDLTGATPKAEIRDRAGGNILLDMPLTITLPNVIAADLSPDDSKKLTRASAVFDLQLTLANGTVATVIAGTVLVVASVTDST